MGHGPDDASETDGTDWQWLGDERRDGPRRPTRWSANDDPLSRRSVLRGAGVAGVGLAVGAGTAGASSIDSGSCEPTDRDGSPPPGPSVLYDDPVTAPQFENGSGWRADPLLVSGAEAHVDGEYLYQDWVFDDYGANTADGDTPPQPPTSTSLTKPVGDVVYYPTDDDTYRDNAADLLEFRTRPAKGGVAYRFTLNTMVAPDVAGVAVGIATGEETGRTDWGYGLGDLGAPVDHVLVTWGTGGELDGTTDGVRSVSVDERRNQIEVVVDLGPGEETWQHYCVTGVFDAEAERFKRIQEEADEDNPGGARGSNPRPSSTPRSGTNRWWTTARSPSHTRGATRHRPTRSRPVISPRSTPRWTSGSSVGTSPIDGSPIRAFSTGSTPRGSPSTVRSRSRPTRRASRTTARTRSSRVGSSRTRCTSPRAILRDRGIDTPLVD
ncbi:hypothetical protein BRC90_06660 [Halobacteriales archaeon QS_4_69_34]|nr:MAG: hypothetical protein BRC90_06660 [Halobacteriales archaeon QS_4_69_34]